MEGDLHAENLEELIRITKIEELKDNYALFYEKREVLQDWLDWF